MAKAIPTRDHLWLNDFATLFAHEWYRDFPMHPRHRPKPRRPDWTRHIAGTVRTAADIMGLFTHFESVNRIDAVLRDNKSATIAALEWEWLALHNGKLNEFTKLMSNCWGNERLKGIQFACLIGYARKGTAAAVLDNFTAGWIGDGLPPLLLVAIHFEWKGRKIGRRFSDMTMVEITGGKRRTLREQPAYPWEVAASRWEQETRTGA